MRAAIAVPLRISLPIPAQGDWLPLGIMAMAFQPFGSFASLGGFLAIGLFALLTHLIPYRPTTNFLLGVCIVAAAGLLRIFFGGINPGLSAFYVLYAGILVLVGILVSGHIRRLKRESFDALIALILLFDLLFNLPSVLIQLAVHGPGDFVQGFSGILLSDALSQNRTNSVRAGFFIILCLANAGTRFRVLRIVSLAFNVVVLFLATSMTTIFSALAAAGVFIFTSLDPARMLVFGSLGAGLAFLANALNRAVFTGTASVFDFLMSLDTRWLPKLDIYSFLFGSLIRQDVLLPIIGFGVGNFCNRFAVLANFASYSRFPFKDAISSLFNSAPTRDYIVDRYNLEMGIVGNSIISVPWSGILALLAEWGFLGLLVLGLVGWPWLRCFLPSRKHLSFGFVLLLFLAFNMLFECYLDFPEVAGPFLVVSACVIRLGQEQRKIEALPDVLT